MSDASLDPNTPHPARRYNYWLGGKDNFAADRYSGDLVQKFFPTIRQSVRENRDFLQRAITFLAREQGISQFLDIGAGLPSADNTHEVVQRINPAARVVYVDNDPLVTVHGRALLLPTADSGDVTIVEADLRDPGIILADSGLREALDLSKPVGLLLVAVLHFLDDTEYPHRVVSELLDALPGGSWLVVSHVSQDLLTSVHAEQASDVIAKSEVPTTLRTHQQITEFFTGLELTEPGVIPVERWRPEKTEAELPASADIGIYGGVARKPG